jgi:hypothetical protein
MAIPAPRELKIGTIVDKTLGVLEINAVPALIYVLVLTAVSVPITYASVGSTAPLQLAGGQLLRNAISIVCGYFLLVAMLRRTGLQSQTGGDTLLPFIGQSIIASLAVLVGMIALIIPGLFLMARWSIAQPLLVARGDGVMASLGESWDRTKGNELSIFTAAVAVVLLPIVVIIATGVFFGQENLAGIVIAQLATSALSLILLAMGVALYGLIVGRDGATAPSA